MKRLISLMLVLCLVLSLMPAGIAEELMFVESNGEDAFEDDFLFEEDVFGDEDFFADDEDLFGEDEFGFDEADLFDVIDIEDAADMPAALPLAAPAQESVEPELTPEPVEESVIEDEPEAEASAEEPAAETEAVNAAAENAEANVETADGEANAEAGAEEENTEAAEGEEVKDAEAADGAEEAEGEHAEAAEETEAAEGEETVEEAEAREGEEGEPAAEPTPSPTPAPVANPVSSSAWKTVSVKASENGANTKAKLVITGKGVAEQYVITGFKKSSTLKVNLSTGKITKKSPVTSAKLTYVTVEGTFVSSTSAGISGDPGLLKKEGQMTLEVEGTIKAAKKPKFTVTPKTKVKKKLKAGKKKTAKFTATWTKKPTLVFAQKNAAKNVTIRFRQAAGAVQPASYVITGFKKNATLKIKSGKLKAGSGLKTNTWTEKDASGKTYYVYEVTGATKSKVTSKTKFTITPKSGVSGSKLTVKKVVADAPGMLGSFDVKYVGGGQVDVTFTMKDGARSTVQVTMNNGQNQTIAPDGQGVYHASFQNVTTDGNYKFVVSFNKVNSGSVAATVTKYIEVSVPLTPDEEQEAQGWANAAVETVAANLEHEIAQKSSTAGATVEADEGEEPLTAIPLDDNRSTGIKLSELVPTGDVAENIDSIRVIVQSGSEPNVYEYKLDGSSPDAEIVVPESDQSIIQLTVETVAKQIDGVGAEHLVESTQPKEIEIVAYSELTVTPVIADGKEYWYKKLPDVAELFEIKGGTYSYQVEYTLDDIKLEDDEGNISLGDLDAETYTLAVKVTDDGVKENGEPLKAEASVTFKVVDQVEDATGNVYKESTETEGLVLVTGKSEEASITVPQEIDVFGEKKIVTMIGKDAFKGNTTLTTITLPNEIEVIGESAFEGCTNLTTMTTH